MLKFRIEHDSLGEKQIPEAVYYGIQTQRAVENFEVSGLSLDKYVDIVWAIASIKKAAALANYRCGAIDKELCGAICKAAQEVMDGKMRGQFPIDIFQGGGGTSANMNVNEVIANRANEILTGKKGYLQKVMQGAGKK